MRSIPLQIAVTAVGLLFAAPAYADRNPDPDRPCAAPTDQNPNGNEAACTACLQKYNKLPDQQTIGGYAVRRAE